MHGETAPRRDTTSDDAYEAVLLREWRNLSGVAAVCDLYRWRDELLAELVRPESPYARVIARSLGTGKGPQHSPRHADFLDRWSGIVTRTIQRLQRSGAVTSRQLPSDLAAAILAAIHGGVLLARVTNDEEVLRDALQLPFDQLCARQRRPGDG
jgi:hypothetical protein